MGLLGGATIETAFILDWLTQFFNRGQITGAGERAREDRDTAVTGAGELQETISAEQLLQGTGFDQPFGQAIAPFQDQFTSADVFRRGVDFEPVNVEDFRYDPTELQALGSQLGTDLRGGAIDFDTLLRQSNVEGLTDRAAARFPDFTQFRTERLGGIAEAAREAQRQAGQELGGGFSSLEEGQAEQQRRQFAGQLSAGRAGSAVESAVEALLGQKAVTLGGIEQAETMERGRLATDAALDARLRDIGGADIEGRMFAQGEGLEAQNLGLLADIERFNQTVPIDIASREAQFTSSDQAQQFNAMMSFLAPKLQAAMAAEGFDVTLEQLKAQLLTSFQEPVPLLSSSFMTNLALEQSPDLDQKAGYSVLTVGYSCVDGACRMETPQGSRRLADVAIGDYVMAADGRFRKVVAKDYGTVPQQHRIRQLLIQTARGWLSVTEDHPLGGRAARLWRPGDAVPTLDGRQRIVSVRTIPYRISGDLMLEGNVDYVANGFLVNSVIGNIGLERWTRFLAA